MGPAIPTIQGSLARRRITRVCHMTSCDRLPDIVRYGGLLSYSERIQSAVPEPEVPHYWGSADKKDALASYVICSFMPPWWMCKKRNEELAMILLDASAVCCHQGTRFCPVNSALNLFTACRDHLARWP